MKKSPENKLKDMEIYNLSNTECKVSLLKKRVVGIRGEEKEKGTESLFEQITDKNQS